MKTKVEYDVIRCLTGWQIEATLPGNWTLYSAVFRGPANGEAAVRRSLATLQGVVSKRDLVFVERNIIDDDEVEEAEQ